MVVGSVSECADTAAFAVSFELDALPALTVLTLGCELDLASLGALQRTCKRLHRLLQHRFVYRVLYERMFGHAVTLCCLHRRLHTVTSDDALSLRGLARALNAHVERADSLPLDAAACVELRSRLAWPLQAQTLDFCCDHWAAILRRRIAVQHALVFAPHRRRIAAAEMTATVDHPLSPPHFAPPLSPVPSLPPSLSLTPPPLDELPNDATSAAAPAPAAPAAPAVESASVESAAFETPSSLDSDGEYEVLPIGAADDVPPAPVGGAEPHADDDDDLGYSNVWSVADNYDDYEHFQEALENADAAAATAPPAADNGDDNDAAAATEHDAAASHRGVFEPEDERRKIREHQIFNPRYEFGHDDLADARVYFARANVLSHYVYHQVTTEASADEPLDVQRRRHFRAWSAACVSNELYASAAVCRARLAGCDCMNSLVRTDELSNVRGAPCVCDEFDRDWAASLATAPRAAAKVHGDNVPNRSHRTPIQMTDIHKEWGALLTAASRLVTIFSSDAPTSQRDEFERIENRGDGGGDDDDDDSDDDDGDAHNGAASATPTVQKLAGGNDLTDSELWLHAVPRRTASLSARGGPLSDSDASIDVLAVKFDSDANDDVSVPSGLKFVALESHWLDSHESTLRMSADNDDDDNDDVSAVGAAAAAKKKARDAKKAEQRQRQQQQQQQQRQKVERVRADEYGSPVATSADVASLLRVAAHHLSRAFSLSLRSTQVCETAVGTLEGELREGDERHARFGGDDGERASAVAALESRLRRARARLTSAMHRHVSLLFCMGDVMCDLARLAESDEFELLFACASAHYSAVVRSGVHVALALDYNGATLDTWARDVLSRCVMTFQRESESSSASDAPESQKVRRLNERPTWADVRRLFVAARECFRLAMIEAPDDVVVPVHWGQSLQAEANERRGETAVQLLLASVAHLERAVAARPMDGFVLRCLGDARVDIGKAMRRLAGDDDSGLMRCAQIAELDNDTEPIVSARTVRPLSIYDECDESITRAELGAPVTCVRERGSLRRESVRMLQAADDAYSQAVVARPNYTVAMNNHGLALSTLAKLTSDPAESDALFQRAYDLFVRISEPLTPATYHCQSNFAMTLAAQARILQWRGELTASRRRLRMATAKLRPLLLKGDAWASFCMARVHAVAGRADECRIWLTRCAHRNYLGRATPSQLAFFDSVRDRPWFVEMLVGARAIEGQNGAAARGDGGGDNDDDDDDDDDDDEGD
jgi:hypothetical protein